MEHYKIKAGTPVVIRSGQSWQWATMNTLKEVTFDASDAVPLPAHNRLKQLKGRMVFNVPKRNNITQIAVLTDDIEYFETAV